MHFTLKTNPLKRADLDEFVKCFNPENRHDRQPTWSEDAVHPSTGSGRTEEAVFSERAEEVAGSGQAGNIADLGRVEEGVGLVRTEENASLTPTLSRGRGEQAVAGALMIMKI
ncbi:hypothetical protein SAMN05421755_10603 [Nitrosomonas sp. Nm33]|nr:hypothetical protein SAMN05421755_10603 [Nitrosomonas sp. Nm33]